MTLPSSSSGHFGQVYRRQRRIVIKHIHRRIGFKTDSSPRSAIGPLKALPLPNNKGARVLLLDLVGLLASLRFPLVPVLDGQVESVVGNLQLSADAGLDRLDEPLWALCLLVLVLVCAEDIGERGEGQLLELGCVFLDDGDALLELGEGRVTQLVGARQVRRDVRVWCLEVGMEGSNEGIVGVVEESEGLGAVGVGLVELDRVVDDGV